MAEPLLLYCRCSILVLLELIETAVLVLELMEAAVLVLELGARSTGGSGWLLVRTRAR